MLWGGGFWIVAKDPFFDTNLDSASFRQQPLFQHISLKSELYTSEKNEGGMLEENLQK